MSTSTTTFSENNDKRLRDFVLWCEQKGCELNKVEIKSIDAYKVETPTTITITGGGENETTEREFDRRVYCVGRGEMKTGEEEDEDNNIAIKKGERVLFVPFACCVGTQGLRVGTGGDSLPPF